MTNTHLASPHDGRRALPSNGHGTEAKHKTKSERQKKEKEKETKNQT
jgi:hypothetical protein